MDLLNKLQKIKDALTPIMDHVSHYYRASNSDRYIVWAEDAEGSSFSADNKKASQTIQGTIDLYTKKEGDPAIEQVQNNLNAAEISWYLNSVQYEEDTGFIHYEWVFEV